MLDADETMSDLLKAEIHDLIEGDADGYWIRKTEAEQNYDDARYEQIAAEEDARTRLVSTNRCPGRWQHCER